MTQQLIPPLARQVPHAHSMHGDLRADPYYWLRNREDPEVIAYLDAENAYCAAAMAHTEALQQRLYDELLGRIKQTDLDVPTPIDGHFYYSRTEEGKQYPIHCRKTSSLDAPEEILLDLNREAESHDYLRLGAYRPSPDHRLLAYALDTTGAEKYALRVKDLTTGALLSDEIPGVYYGVEWAADNATLFYVTQDDAQRPHRVWRHRLGDDPAQDTLVYQEDDDTFWLGLRKSDSRRFIFVVLGSKITDEVWYLPADDPAASLRVVAPRRKGIEYGAEHWEDRFFIVTNENAVNFKLMQAPLDATDPAFWEEVIPHDPAVLLGPLHASARHLAIWVRENGLTGLRVMDLPAGTIRSVDFPEPVYTVTQGPNEQFDTNVLRIGYTSLVTPYSVYDLSLDTFERTLLKQTEVLGGYDPTQYESRRITATAEDGTSVPISLVHRRGALDGGPAPALLYGYGSYGSTTDPRFDSNRLSLLDRGLVYAIAHVRGGGEMGRPWYESGKFLFKKNTFTDFIACARHLVESGIAAPDALTAMGGSAGGLLMGAALNLAPEPGPGFPGSTAAWSGFRAVVAHVPFVDVVTTMLDPTIPLTTVEWDEWGDPRDAEYYAYMKSYSPYDNVTARQYPHILVTAGLNDPRVGYWEPAKWVARLRALKTDTNRLLLKTQMGAGHAGPSGRYSSLKETAFAYAFLLDCLGLSAGQPAADR